MPTSHIKTHALVLGYNNHPVVSQITLDIFAGEFIGILGANGSGKSTFLRSILGLLKPLSGKLTVFDHAPQRGNATIGYIPQTRNTFSIAHLNSRALIQASYQGTQLGLPLLSREQKSEIDRVLTLVKANAFADRPFQQLSGGEKQRIYLAQALLGHPRMLILDEPLANLDPYYQEEFIHLLHNIQKTLKATILFTAHDPNPLLGVMNRVFYFAHGKAAIGTVNEVITSAQLSTLYETPIEVITYKNRLLVLGEGRNMHRQDTHHE